ncbi:hypothetical protein G6F62_014651 [Rhizopus arrhizus]|nr:hypothetical protein G6F62_014651 [Rhizopus arrhizus]
MANRARRAICNAIAASWCVRTTWPTVRGPVSSNDGQSALEWALAGHGIVMRSEWETAAYLRAGRLREVLTDWRTPPADIHALYPERLNLPAKTVAFVDFLSQRFARHLRTPGGHDAVW